MPGSREVNTQSGGEGRLLSRKERAQTRGAGRLGHGNMGLAFPGPVLWLRARQGRWPTFRGPLLTRTGRQDFKPAVGPYI